MIKLARPNAPPELTQQRSQELTATYAADHNQRVWNQGYIRNRLLAMSHNKCAYCESLVDEESKYMEVDHYRCKDHYPGEVVKWNNLLPACKRCNVNKSNHDVVTNGDLIDPSVDDPPMHLFLFNYRLYGRDERGTRAIDVLYLNETDRTVRARFNIGNAISSALDELQGLLIECTADPTQPRLRRLARGFVKILQEATPSSEYSATAATSLLRHPYFGVLKSGLENLNLWNNDLSDLEAIVVRSALA
jgi:uncharacterized protein (TIGR02646 family)